MDTATTSPSTQIPGCVFIAVNKEGTEIFSHAAGKKGVDSSEAMTSETVFWIASCTKMIAGIACMQLVEQGKLKLDDAEQAETLAPELKRVKILKGVGDDGKPVLEEKKNRITLRMLLSHTGMFLLSF
jgi:CubicO group peptidase (beta-lactamase class C family)